MTRGRVLATALVAPTLLCLFVAASGQAREWTTYPGDYRTLLVSRADGADGSGADADSLEPSTSLDALYVGFTSAAHNLGPTRGHRQVFLREMASGRTILVSRADGRRGAPAAGDSGEPAVSGAGWKVAFTSRGANLGGRRGVRSVYLRNARTGDTVLVSRATGAQGAPADGESFDPTVSHDGRLVAFASTATNLGGPTDGRTAVYVRDLETGRTSLVSRSTGGAPANSDATEPSISPGGDVVAFVSAATNLSPLARGGVREVYEHRLRGGGTVLVSRAPGRDGAAADTDATHPSVDQRGDRVAFQSAAGNLGEGAPSVQSIYLRDLKGGETWLMSRGFKHHMRPGAPADADSEAPSLSRDGRFVCFQSAAGNLGSAYGGMPRPGVTNVFVHDTRSLGTFLISRAAGRHGAAADGDSTDVACSAGASLAVFQSAATNLSPAADPGVVNVYRRTIFGGR